MRQSGAGTACPVITFHFSTYTYTMTGLLITIASALAVLPLRVILPSAAAIALHELGHIAAIYAFGGGIEKITFSPFGLTIKEKAGIYSYKTDAAVALAGCAVNFLSAGAALLISGISAFVLTSAVYGTFNLLPVSTLDGGQALSAMIHIFSENDESAGRILKITSGVTITLLWLSGIYMMLLPGCGVSLFFMTIYLFSSIYLKR